MLFHSVEFLLFFPVVFVLYWATARWMTAQNCLLLSASYVFYGWWDWRFLILIALSSFVDFSIGLLLHRTINPTARRWQLGASLAFNIGLLAYFKYSNFFIIELREALQLAGITTNMKTLDIILPVGISFYTFQTLSYTVDIYRNRLKPTRDPIAFCAFVAFFPQLVAGPIERASQLLPQFSANRKFQYTEGVAGGRLILLGFFKKLVIADSCAPVVDHLFANFDTQSGWVLSLGLFLFAFQIYGDFSGYSDIARGLAKLLGFELMQNFAFPYFSSSVGEFWRRWHISLSTWFRDYVFIPLGGSRGGTWHVLRNLLVVFTISGLWHGPSWNFVVWGAINACLIVPSAVLGARSASRSPNIAGGKLVPTISEVGRIAFTFAAICMTWAFFRSESLAHACAYLTHMISDAIQHPGGIIVLFNRLVHEQAFHLVMLLVVCEWVARWERFRFDRCPVVIRWTLYQVMFSITIWSAFYRAPSDFLYFQF